MEEILFRGKPVKPYTKTIKEDGSLYVEFEYGGFYRDFCYGGCPKGKDYIICFNSSGLGFNEHVLVEKDSVGQYIGLKDKNDKRIFTRDIVKVFDVVTSTHFNGYVDYANGSFCIKNGYCSRYRWVDYQVEVVGNMCDNPELLKIL